MKKILPLVLIVTVAGCGSGDGDGTASVTTVAAGAALTPEAIPTPAPTPSPTPMAVANTQAGPLALSGAISPVHDPAILKDGSTYYLFATGNTGDAEGLLALRTSTDLTNWQYRGPSYTALPAWATKAVPKAAGMWAPDISKTNDQYRLYYSVSSFGSNQSAIGLATASKIDPDAPAANWQDRGPVIQSSTSDNYNAIDPMAFTDVDGTQWLVFGSFWSGIKLIQLDPATGLRLPADPSPRALAQRPAPGAVEGPYIVRHGGYYYLFVAFDNCCQGASSTYNTVVGRAPSVAGPYVDRNGKPMLQGGGTPVLTNGQSDGSRYVGRGGAVVLQGASGDYIVYHAYDRQRNGAPTLQIQRLTWDAAGWPIAS